MLDADDMECPNVESLIFQVQSLGSYFRSQKATLAKCSPLDWWHTKGGKHVTTFIQGNKTHMHTTCMHTIHTNRLYCSCYCYVYLLSTGAARMYLAIPASSASSERVFSGAGYIFSKRRQAMNAASLSSLVFIRENTEDNLALQTAYAKAKATYDLEQQKEKESKKLVK